MFINIFQKRLKIHLLWKIDFGKVYRQNMKKSSNYILCRMPKIFCCCQIDTKLTANLEYFPILILLEIWNSLSCYSQNKSCMNLLSWIIWNSNQEKEFHLCVLVEFMCPYNKMWNVIFKPIDLLAYSWAYMSLGKKPYIRVE